MDAPRFTILAVERREWPFLLRMPFRFGVITVRDGRQAVVRVRIRTEDGREGWGVSAETLAAKWFDKNQALSDADNMDQLRRALEIACEAGLAHGADTAWGHFANRYAAHVAACAAEALNPLIAAYGQSLLDRACFDALLKLVELPFHTAMRGNLGGMAAHDIIADLGDFDAAGMLGPIAAPSRIHARHTVGLVDPITAADVTERVDDGLPETLEEVARHYGHRWWKLKVGGNLAADIDRLCQIAAVLDAGEAYQASLDGNEQYGDGESALALWHAMMAEPRLAGLCASIAYIEQPVARARALDTSMGALAKARPVIIDESDGDLSAFVTAKGLGYAGVSTKACKGFWRSFVNHARCRAWNDAGGQYFMSAEDLTTLAGLCVQQDLALVSALGLRHVERNGHHFIAGFQGRPKAEAVRFMEAHPGLYADTAHGPRLAIREGALDIASIAVAGFGAAEEPDFAAMEPMKPAAWPKR